MSLFNLKALAGRSTALVTAWHVYDNYKTKRMGRRGTVETPSGSTHLHFNLEESLRYIRSVYEDYCTYGQMNASAFSEKRILEIGPETTSGSRSNSWSKVRDRLCVSTGSTRSGTSSSR